MGGRARSATWALVVLALVLLTSPAASAYAVYAYVSDTEDTVASEAVPAWVPEPSAVVSEALFVVRLAPYLVPCLDVGVDVDDATFGTTTYDPAACAYHPHVRVRLDEERLWGDVTFPRYGSRGPEPGDGSKAGSPAVGVGVDVPPPPDVGTPASGLGEAVPAPSASAAFQVSFEVRFRPCEPPVFRVAGEARVNDEALDGGAPQDAAAVEAGEALCAQAAGVVEGASGPVAWALDVNALVRTVLDVAAALPVPAASAAAEEPHVPVSPSAAMGCACASGQARGEARLEGGEADADWDVDADATAPGAEDGRSIGVVSATEPPGNGSADDVPPAGPSSPGPGASSPAAERPSIQAGDEAERPGARPGLHPVRTASATGPLPVELPVAHLAVPHALVVFSILGLGLLPRVLGAIVAYTRLSGREVLDHRLRRAVYDLVRDEGPVQAGRVAARLAEPRGTVEYHLNRLVRGSLLVRVRTRGGVVFHVGHVDAEDLPEAPTLGERIAHLVGERPGLNMADVARALGVSKRAAQNQVLALLTAGELSSAIVHGSRRLYPPSE